MLKRMDISGDTVSYREADRDLVAIHTMRLKKSDIGGLELRECDLKVRQVITDRTSFEVR
jgi:hypothetical protein